MAARYSGYRRVKDVNRHATEACHKKAPYSGPRCLQHTIMNEAAADDNPLFVSAEYAFMITTTLRTSPLDGTATTLSGI